MAGAACPAKAGGPPSTSYCHAQQKPWMPTPAFAWGRLFVGMTMRAETNQNVSTKSPPNVNELLVPFVLDGGLLLNGLLSV